MGSNLIVFSSYYHQCGRGGVDYAQWDDEFVMYDDLIPIVKVLPRPAKIRDTLLMDAWGTGIFKWGIEPNGAGTKMTKRWYRGRTTPFHIFSGFYSAIGFRDVIYENIKLGISNSTKWSVRSDHYDVLMLGVLKKPYRYDPHVEMNRHFVNVREDNIVILVNKEKLDKNVKFLKENYSSTVRMYLKSFLNTKKAQGTVEIRVVPDNYLSNFIKQGVDLNITSVVELLKTQNKARNKVFTTLNLQSITV